MQSNNQTTYRVDANALQKYVRFQFSDYNPPPLEQFLNVKKCNYSEIKAQIITAQPHTQLQSQVADILESEAIYYLQSGVIQLHKKQKRHWKRDIEYKQGNFFTLLNYKNIHSPQQQWYKLIFKTKVVISVLPIRPAYNYQWMKSVWHKNTLLSKIFLYNDPECEMEKKKHRFSQFIKKFKSQKFRRDTRIIQQGKKNQYIYIISKGQARMFKHLHTNINGKGQDNKQVQILYLREGAIFGSELFLINSKSIHTIIMNHNQEAYQSQQRNQSKLTIKQEENQQSQNEQIQIRKSKKKPKSRLGKIMVQSGGYELYSPHENISNFTVIAQSANLQLLYVQIDYLVTLISQRYKINFLKLLQSTYITILRRTYQKMSLQLKKSQQKILNNHSKIQTMAAKAYSNLDNQSEIISEEHEGITMKVSQIGTAKSTINELKNQQVRKAQNNQMQKRTQLIIKQKKPVIDFKQKIQALIESKLANKNENNTNQIIQDFTEIFMKKNEGRSQDIQKRANLLDRKKVILDKRGGWKPGWNQLKQEGVTIQRKKTIQTPNYLNGLKVQNYTTSIKQKCNHKIQQTNKIKQQFMKIRSQCPTCSCYDGFQNFSTARRSMTCMGRTGYKTAEGWGKTTKVNLEQESLQNIYHRMTFLSERTKQKYNHNIHLLQVRRNRTQLQRRKSAPKF